MWIREQADDGSEVFEASGGNSENAERITRWGPTTEAAFGRGVGDTDITYLRLQDAAGTNYYCYIVAGAMHVDVAQP